MLLNLRNMIVYICTDTYYIELHKNLRVFQSKLFFMTSVD